MIDDKTVAFDHSKVDSRRVVVSDHSLAGARLGDVDLSGYRAVVTRVRRGDTDMVAHPDLMLELGRPRPPGRAEEEAPQGLARVR